MFMNNKAFLHKINDIKDLQYDRGAKFKRIRLFFLKRGLRKMVHQAAQIQAKAMYKQTCNFYEDIIDSNLKQKF